MPRLKGINAYKDEYAVYYYDELRAMGCSHKLAKKIHSCTQYTHQIAKKSFLKAYEYELPIGNQIEEMTNDESIIPLRRMKNRSPRELE